MPLAAEEARSSEARCAGDDAGSALSRVVVAEGVEGEDFWKKPRMDRWFFMFCVLDEDRFRLLEAGVVAPDAAPVPLAIADSGNEEAKERPDYLMNELSHAPLILENC